MMMKLILALVVVGVPARASAVPPAHAAFHAEVNDNTKYTAGDTVVFKSVLTNDGNEYDKNTGVFTASTNDKYVFSLSMRVGQGNAVRKLELFSKAHNKVIATVASNKSSSALVIVKLSVGDTVLVRNVQDDSVYDVGTTFSGFNLD